MSDIPNTNVVRHWVGWDQDEWDEERARQFDAWLDGQIRAERERILARLEEWKTDDCGKCPRCSANREIIWIIEAEN